MYECKKSSGASICQLVGVSIQLSAKLHLQASRDQLLGVSMTQRVILLFSTQTDVEPSTPYLIPLKNANARVSIGLYRTGYTTFWLPLCVGCLFSGTGLNPSGVITHGYCNMGQAPRITCLIPNRYGAFQNPASTFKLASGEIRERPKGSYGLEPTRVLQPSQ